MIQEGKDKLVWTVASSEKYKSKDGFLMLGRQDGRTSLPWKLCWDNKCLQKVGAIAWITI